MQTLKAKHAKPTSGGSSWSKLAEEWWGIQPSEVSRWIAISEKKTELLDNTQNLLDSYQSVAVVASMTGKARRAGVRTKKITSKSTQADIAAYEAKTIGHPTITPRYYLSSDDKDQIRGAFSGDDLELFNKAFPVRWWKNALTFIICLDFVRITMIDSKKHTIGENYV